MCLGSSVLGKCWSSGSTDGLATAVAGSEAPENEAQPERPQAVRRHCHHGGHTCRAGPARPGSDAYLQQSCSGQDQWEAGGGGRPSKEGGASRAQQGTGGPIGQYAAPSREGGETNVLTGSSPGGPDHRGGESSMPRRCR